MSVCEPVSRESLLTNFLLLPDAVVGSLRTMIVGPDYAVRDHDTLTGDGLVGPYDETVGVSSAWPGLGANETVDQATAAVLVVDALVNYYADTNPTPGAAEGVQNGTAPNEILHNGGATVWSGPSFTPALNNAVEVGDYVLLDDKAGTTLETRVQAIDFTGSVPNILVLEDNLPAALTGGAFFNVILAEVVPEVTLVASDTTLTATTVAANAAITLTTTRVSPAAPLIAGKTFTGDDLSNVYTDYRALRANSPATQGVLAIDSVADLDTYFIGWEDPASDLGFAVARALAPEATPGATLPIVRCIAPTDTTTAAWQAAANLIQRRTDWSTVAPLSSDSTIQNIFTAVLQARETLDLDSRAFYALTLTEETVLVTGAGNTVEVDASLTPGFDRTVTRDGGITDPFNGVVPGDIVQIAGTDYIVDSVVSNQVVTITTSASAGAGQVLNNVRHVLTPAEQADDYGTRASAIDDPNISVVFPPDPTWSGESVEGYHLAAASAGLRGYTIPHQSLNKVLLETGWGVPSAGNEFLAFLDDLADDGCFVYSICDQLPEPNAVVDSANTTDQSTTLSSREGLQANSDAIKRYITGELSSFVGTSKVTIDTLASLRSEANVAIEFLRSSTIVTPFGAIMTSGTVGQPVQNPVQLDVVDMPVAIEIAAGLERLNINTVISISVVA